MKVMLKKSTLQGWAESIKQRQAEGRKVGSGQMREEVERVSAEGGEPPVADLFGHRQADKAPVITFKRPGDAARGGGIGEGSPYGHTSMKSAIAEIVETQPGKIPQLADAGDVALHKRFHDLHDSLALLNVMKNSKQPGSFRASEADCYKEFVGLGERLSRKILYSTYTGFGAEFIPNTLSASLIPIFRDARSLVNSMRTIPLPTSPYNFPVQGVDVKPYLVTENTSDDPAALAQANYIPARTPATSKVTFTANGFKVRGLVSAEAEEDSIISQIDFLRDMLVQSEVDGLEDCAINGDTTATHQDSDVTAATDHRKAFKGFRKLASAAAKINAGGDKLTTNDILTARTKMGKFASDQRNCAIIVSQIGMTHLVGDVNFITFEKAGGAATLPTGAVGVIFGIPVITSGFLREDLSAAGVYSASVNRTHCIVAHRPSFAFGMRRGMTLGSMFDIQSDRHIIVVTMRVDFQRIQAEVTSGNIAYNCVNIYNVDKAATF